MDDRKYISLRLVRLCVEMRDIAKMLDSMGFTEKAKEMVGASKMAEDWASEILKEKA